MKLTLLASAIAISSVATATVPAAWPDTRAEAAAPMPQRPAAQESMTGPRGRCGTCGIVQAVRRIEHGGGVAATFEITVRLRDGSIRTSSSTGSARWRGGDSIMLIGGAATPAGGAI